MGRHPWTLAAFPQGYELFLHKSPPRQQGARSPTASRRDFLLYGACLQTKTLSTTTDACAEGSTDVSFFSSPLEFVPHAHWLMRGARRTPDKSRAPRCRCKYCDVDDRKLKQSVISHELRARRARVWAQLGDADSATGDADTDT
jgi:hypothetical protein